MIAVEGVEQSEMIRYKLPQAARTSLWPPDERVSASLGERGTALRAPIRMRWARHEDVKRRGAHHESEFYRRYGEDAGKTPYETDAPPKELGRKRKRGEKENGA